MSDISKRPNFTRLGAARNSFICSFCIFQRQKRGRLILSVAFKVVITDSQCSLQTADSAPFAKRAGNWCTSNDDEFVVVVAVVVQCSVVVGIL